jgi:hypothetical protein
MVEVAVPPQVQPTGVEQAAEARVEKRTGLATPER